MNILFFNTVGRCEICADCNESYNQCIEQECGNFLGNQKKTCIKKSNCQYDTSYTDCKKKFCAEEEDATKNSNENNSQNSEGSLLPP